MSDAAREELVVSVRADVRRPVHRAAATAGQAGVGSRDEDQVSLVAVLHDEPPGPGLGADPGVWHDVRRQAVRGRVGRVSVVDALDGGEVAATTTREPPPVPDVAPEEGVLLPSRVSTASWRMSRHQPVRHDVLLLRSVLSVHLSRVDATTSVHQTDGPTRASAVCRDHQTDLGLGAAALQLPSDRRGAPLGRNRTTQGSSSDTTSTGSGTVPALSETAGVPTMGVVPPLRLRAAWATTPSTRTRG
jgi:hypothetical protein